MIYEITRNEYRPDDCTQWSRGLSLKALTWKSSITLFKPLGIDIGAEFLLEKYTHDDMGVLTGGLTANLTFMFIEFHLHIGYPCYSMDVWDKLKEARNKIERLQEDINELNYE